MNPAFLALANVVLCARLLVLFRDDVAEARIWRIKSWVEIGVAVFLLPWGWELGAVAGALAAFNYLGFRAERRNRRKDLTRLILGIATLAVLSVLLAPRLNPGICPGFGGLLDRLRDWTALAPLLDLAASPRCQLVLFGLLLAANEANLVLRSAFDWLDLKPRAPAAGGVVDVGELNRGRIIGILERGLLYGFVLQGQYGAIGFVLAAKAFTRFKALDDRPFAEYVLVGTLLSAGLALLAGGMVRWLLHH